MIHLMVKQHSVTGLKYFCKTTRNSPLTYKGSGKHWKHHINHHGRQYVQTIEHWTFEDLNEAIAFAKDFSVTNNIVESDQWANLIEENATDGAVPGIPSKTKGSTRHFPAEHIEKMKQNRKTQKWYYNPITLQEHTTYGDVPEGFVRGRPSQIGGARGTYNADRYAKAVATRRAKDSYGKKLLNA